MVTLEKIKNIINEYNPYHFSAEINNHFDFLLVKKDNSFCMLKLQEHDDYGQTLVMVTYDEDNVIAFDYSCQINDDCTTLEFLEQIKYILFNLAFYKKFSRNYYIPFLKEVKEPKEKVQIELDMKLVGKNIINEILKPLIKRHYEVKGVHITQTIIDKVIHFDIFVSKHKDFERYKQNIGKISFNVDSFFDYEINFLNDITFNSYFMKYLNEKLIQNDNLVDNFLQYYRTFFYDKELI